MTAFARRLAADTALAFTRARAVAAFLAADLLAGQPCSPDPILCPAPSPAAPARQANG